MLRVTQVTPLMRRITLGGPELAGFGTGPNLKVLIPPAGEPDPQWPVDGPDGRPVWPAERGPTVRTYTVRRYDERAGELDVDFVMHGDHGVASAWAGRAVPGDPVAVAGPGGRDFGEADWYMIAGDHTSLPVISTIVERMAPDARGHVFIEVPSAEEEQPLSPPEGVRLTWLHHGDAPAGSTTLLRDAVTAVPWPEDGERVFGWVSGESSAVRELRAYFRDERKLHRRQYVAIGYWRRGLDEHDYHEQFDNDRDADYFRAGREERGEPTQP
ncbi:siderophore-interacting protein [Nonomuraea sp. NPDC050404]|uniref:siderophore-interacting protein n=1 Tax=Nonomuraea sp. NPDC050404 TaxID=3155783 RepID=UPI0033FE2D67